MTDNKIAEIRARHEINDRYRGWHPGAHKDRATLLAEVDRMRADNERLFNEDTKTRHALKGWVFVCPDGGDEPTHERVAAVVAEVERLRAALRWYADHRNHFPVLHHRRAGDPDPVAVFAEEPPIMSDGGRRAREALEAKP